MKRTIAILAVCTAPLWAAAQAPTAQQPAGPVAGRIPLGVTVVEMETIVSGWSAEKDLLDKTVVNDKKERIGKIEDLIIRQGQGGKLPVATFAIVGVGGFLGVGTRDVVIPMEQLRVQDKNLMLPGATKEALKALPEFKYQRR